MGGIFSDFLLKSLTKMKEGSIRKNEEQLENTSYTGALFDTPHTPPTLPAFDFQISN